MGWCADFGCRISDGCDHAMVAGAGACTCHSCGVRCEGRFHGCADVWAAGPRPGEPPRLKMAPAPVAQDMLAGTDPNPGIDALGAAVESLRRDVDSVSLGLADAIDGLREAVNGVDGRARALGDGLEGLRREVEVVAALLAQQPAMFAAMTEANAAAVADLAAQHKEEVANGAMAHAAMMADVVALQQATSAALAELHLQTTRVDARSVLRAGRKDQRPVLPALRSRLPPSPLEPNLDRQAPGRSHTEPVEPGR